MKSTHSVRNSFMVVMLLAVLLSGCVWNEPVATNQMAVWSNGGQLMSCVGPGVYTGDILNPFQELIQVNSDIVAFEVEDPEVATASNQLVGIKVSLQVRRKTDCESLKGMLASIPSIKDDNNAIIRLLDPLVREGMKNGVRQFELDALLSDRNGLGTAILESVADDAKRYYLEIVGVQISNVALNASYAQLLQDKANLVAQKELKVKEQDLIRQVAANTQFEQEQTALTLSKQLEAEKVRTSIEVEIARREGEKVAASQQVYSLNPQAFELEKLKLMANIFGKGTIYYLPAGTSFSAFLGNPLTSVISPTNP